MTRPTTAGATDVSVASAGGVRAEQVQAILHVVIDRQDKLNAINSAVLAGLRAALSWAANDLSIRVVVLRGEGRGFSAGGDLAEVSELADDAASLNSFLDDWHGTVEMLELCPLPIVAAVHGVVFAGGLEVVQACDVVVVGDQTVIGDQHANFGIFPAGGSTQRLPRLIGLRRAKWFLMSGEAISPMEALEAGLVTRVVPESEVLPEAIRMATVLASKSPAAIAAIKQAVRLGMDRPLMEAFAAERDIALRHQTSEDAALGYRAFTDRATPEFPRRA